ncbi:SRPBCC family protein [Poseidonocella sp. HB161398]|uniref:SRPBCC family protein n=1 Tax=Poseidonocella sp. HB161398 TaxID=2320855 RepID=UPI00110910C6|nr:SRPBCC family protein [Poseidonocella sp. HB161398]
MKDMIQDEAYGTLTGPTELTIRRRLPGPAERIWRYLADSELRRKWLASGDMVPEAGRDFTLTWRNDELTDPPGERPEGLGDEHSMACTVLEAEENRVLAFTWGTGSEVRITLEPKGEEVLLTLVHRKLMDRGSRLGVSAGWHAHLDILAARLSGTDPAPFWDAWQGLRADYDARLPE